MASNHPEQKSELTPLDASRLRIRRSQNLQPVSWLANPPSGFFSSGTDHMLTVRWKDGHGWEDPEIVPYEDLKLPPTASCLHYATQCYEGMKVYRGYDGRLRLFRPDRNCERLATSATRVSLPTFDPKELERLIIALIGVDGFRWLPADTCRGKALYVRPAMIANEPQIGVRLPGEALLFVIIVPWPELDTKVLAEGLQLITSRDDTVRAWPGGFGSAKLGANYGPNFISLGEARSQGFDQVLWLFGEKGIVTEAGSSNFFIVCKTPEGIEQLITAPLDDKIILPGVTRDSVLRLVQSRLNNESVQNYSSRPLQPVERQFTMAEIESASKEGRLVEAFVSGTAYFITPVSRIQWRGQDIYIPLAQSPNISFATTIRTWLQEIMYGSTKDPWAVDVPESA